MVQLMGISGSLRQGSLNAALLRAAVGLMPEGSALAIGTIRGIPLYDADVEAQGIPEPVAALKEKIAAADGLLLVTPEYNNSIPGVFKNAIDWLSRPPADVGRVFRGKPVALIGASPGAFGTILSQSAWLPVLRTLGTELWSEGRLLVSRAPSVFAEDGTLSDPQIQRAARRLPPRLHGLRRETPMTATAPHDAWPALPYAAWRDTCATLHLWTQVVGKIRLAQTPWLNHSWHVPLYVTARGLGTSPIPHGSRFLELSFDFIDHALDIATSDGARRRIALRPRTVADFHRSVMAALDELGLPVRIDERPCEIPAAIPFSQDRTHAAYDAAYAHSFWRALLQIDRVLKKFRTGFIGKSSPVHFFWGSFDIAVTRFSGRTAPPHPGGAPGVADAVMREAYSHEVSSAGFWPGGGGIDFPAFYSYAYPTPDGFEDAPVRPAPPPSTPRSASSCSPTTPSAPPPTPDSFLLSFLQSTYEAAADTAGWDRAALDCAPGLPRVPRPLG